MRQLEFIKTKLAISHVKNKNTNLLFKITNASMESSTEENLIVSPIWPEGTGAENLEKKLLISGKDIKPDICRTYK